MKNSDIKIRYEGTKLSSHRNNALNINNQQTGYRTKVQYQQVGNYESADFHL